MSGRAPRAEAPGRARRGPTGIRLYASPVFLVLCGAMLVASTFLGALPLVLAAMAGAIALGAEGAARRRSRGAHRRVRGTHRRPRAAPAAGTPAAAPPAGEAATGADEVIVQDGAVVRDAAPVEAGKSGTAR